ncbi:MAG: hypothetical protein JWO46_1684 [Nocardioidaceae bacterium]|nr:hypothetical protein [Nocardioidaceae bacterium]
MSTALLVHLLPFADKTPADNDVVAGWLGGVVFLGLVLAVALLGFSLSRHLKKARAGFAAEDESSSDVPPTR